MEKTKLKKIISKIDEVDYIGDKIYIIIGDYSLELWIGPCSKDVFDKIKQNITKYTFWEWTYFEDSYKVYNWKSVV